MAEHVRVNAAEGLNEPMDASSHMNSLCHTEVEVVLAEMEATIPALISSAGDKDPVKERLHK